MKRSKPYDDTEAFERALAAQPQAEHYLLRLFVTGTTPRSARAIQNIRAICEQKLHGRYDLEVDRYLSASRTGPAGTDCGYSDLGEETAAAGP